MGLEGIIQDLQINAINMNEPEITRENRKREWSQEITKNTQKLISEQINSMGPSNPDMKFDDSTIRDIIQEEIARRIPVSQAEADNDKPNGSPSRRRTSSKEE